MAELDLLNYPGSKLGAITSPAPSVLKPSTKQTPLGPQDKGQEYLAQIEPEMEELKKSTLAKSEVETAQKEQQAQSLAKKQQALSEATSAERQAIEGSAPYQEEKTVQEQLKNAAFVPRQDNAQDLATLFSLINVLGFAIGKGGKGNAQQALAAMDGMAKGYQQGRVDLYKREKDLFDTSMKTLKTKSDVLSKQVQEIVQLAARDKQAASEKADAVFAQEGADFYREYAKRFGLAALAEYDKQRVSGLTKAFELKNNQENKEKELESRERQHRETLASQERLRQATLASQQLRRDEQALRSVGPALRNIAEQYPEGTVNTLLGASPDDKKKVQGAYRAVEESESAADYIARNPGAVGALAVVRNFLKMDAIASLQNPDEAQAAQQKSLLVDDAIDKAQQSGQIKPDDAQAAKVLQKKLFGLALSDVQGSGQRGSVYLDKSFQNLYDQASRQDTLLKIIKERSQDNNRNLKTYKLNIERHNNPEQFPLLENESIEKYIKDRSPASEIPEKVTNALKGKPDGTTAKTKSDGKTYVINGGVVTEVRGQ